MTEIHPGSVAKSKKSYMKKNKEHKKYINNSNFLLVQNINNLQPQIRTLTDISTQNYFTQISEKLESTSINTKCYWSLLKAFQYNKSLFNQTKLTVLIM